MCFVFESYLMAQMRESDPLQSDVSAEFDFKARHFNVKH